MLLSFDGGSLTPVLHDLATLTQKRVYLHPYLHDKIMQWTTWSNPKPLKEPFTYVMLATDAKHCLCSHKRDSHNRFYSLDHVVWDWLRLGVFMGSCVAEDGQSNLKKN
jgi:hypothetical protein